ncbi:PPOX class F420-dependent oxidoreductase [Salarchaeum japonicum]|uniref:PPOX class F420-dependent oxidoreductase n=1 Tax=Salarchaeum japonicum TaxID=555573 RepID=A0AAV3T0V0_9EURY|nr:PPOX class F420-dependent oxidoreductase [Salarchaeum japonicum]
MPAIPEAYRDLFETESFAHFATVMPDGTPHTTPVWVGYEAPGEDAHPWSSGDEHLLVNTARGRRKERNVRQNPKVGVSITDPDDPYRYLSVRGEVESVDTTGAVEHIDALARRYFDVDEYPHHGEEDGKRVVVRIRPDRVVTA